MFQCTQITFCLKGNFISQHRKMFGKTLMRAPKPGHGIAFSFCCLLLKQGGFLGLNTTYQVATILSKSVYH